MPRRVRARLDREQPRLDRPELRPRPGHRRGRPTSGSNRRVVAVIGDGSMTGGMAFEGLNNLGHSGRDCIIILNDNGRSYAPTVSRLGESLVKIRDNPIYMRRQARLEKARRRDARSSATALERALEATKAAVREMWEPHAFFETLGVRYTGPFDGHDIAALEKALRNAAEIERPAGRPRPHPEGPGLRPGRERPDQAPARHRPRPKPGSYTAAFTEALIKEAEDHPEIVAITAAMPDSTGLLPFEERFPDRLLRRRHRRAARRHRGRRHGHGRAAAGRGHLLDVPHPGLRPGQPRRRPAPPAGHLLPRPGRHHRRRRSVAPRRARHGAADQGAGHDRSSPRRRTRSSRSDAPRRARHHRRARWRSAGRRPWPARSRPGRGRLTGCSPPVRHGDRRLPHRRRQDARRGRGGRRRSSRARASRSRCGTPGS